MNYFISIHNEYLISYFLDCPEFKMSTEILFAFYKIFFHIGF